MLHKDFRDITRDYLIDIYFRKLINKLRFFISNSNIELIFRISFYKNNIFILNVFSKYCCQSSKYKKFLLNIKYNVRDDYVYIKYDDRNDVLDYYFDIKKYKKEKFTNDIKLLFKKSLYKYLSNKEIKRDFRIDIEKLTYHHKEKILSKYIDKDSLSIIEKMLYKKDKKEKYYINQIILSDDED